MTLIAAAAQSGKRLLSLDFMRGLIMLLLIMESTGLYEHLSDASQGTAVNGFIQQFFHHPWNGLRFWDLIQPGFMCDRAAIAASRCTCHFCVAGCGMGFCSGCSRVNGICFCMNLWTSLLLFCLWVKIALLALERCCLVLFYFCGNNLVVLPHFHLIRSETQFAPPHLHALLIE